MFPVCVIKNQRYNACALERPTSGNNQGAVVKTVSIASDLASFSIFAHMSWVKDTTNNFIDSGICMCPEVGVLHFLDVTCFSGKYILELLV